MGLSCTTFMGDINNNYSKRRAWISLAVVAPLRGASLSAFKENVNYKQKSIISLFSFLWQEKKKTIISVFLYLSLSPCLQDSFSSQALLQKVCWTSLPESPLFAHKHTQTHTNWLKPSQTVHICIDSKNKWYERKSYCCYSFHPDKTQNAIYAN